MVASTRQVYGRGSRNTDYARRGDTTDYASRDVSDPRRGSNREQQIRLIARQQLGEINLSILRKLPHEVRIACNLHPHGVSRG